MLPRFFVPDGIAPGATPELPDEAAHHAVRVLRLGDGAAVELFDGRGGAWRAQLKIAGKRVLAVLDAFADEDRESPLTVTLVQCLPAADKMDWVVQKGTELGLAAIQPVAARRSVIKLSGERMERRVQHWQQVAVSACEQCGRNRPPPVAPIVDLPQYLGRMAAQNPDHNEARWILAPGGAGSLRNVPAPAGPVVLLVGPEGGFEDEELKAARVAGFQPLTLGPRVMRTETAGMAAVAALMALWGDF